MKFIIIGLGNFGSSLAIHLTSLGHEVIGVDGNELKIENFKDQITQTVCLDCVNEPALRTLPLSECDYAVVAIGEDFGASVMATALLKKIGATRIISRAINPVHQTVVETLGVDMVILPELDSAIRLADRLVYTGTDNSYLITSNYKIIEYEVPARYVGFTLGEIRLEANYNLQPVTIIKKKETKTIFGQVNSERTSTGLITGNEILQKGDILMLFGSTGAIAAFTENLES